MSSNALAPVQGLERLGAVLNAFLDNRSEKTRAAYAFDLVDFARWSGEVNAGAGLAALLRLGAGLAFERVQGYRAFLVERGLSAATINRRLSTLRSAVRFARAAGLVSWTLEVEGLRGEPRRDNRGPGLDVVRGALETAAARGDWKGTRDYALLRLTFDLGLRRGEVINLDLADLDLDGGTVEVLGKGRREKVRLTLPDPTIRALQAWTDRRGTNPGPLFVNGRGERLSGGGTWGLCRRYGFRPHGLRHTAITTALDAGGDPRKVQRFSRHADLRTMMLYDDNRKDLAGEVARTVAATV